MPLREWMRLHNGVAHSTMVRDAGYSAATIRKEIDAGRLTRVRRSWLVDRTCPAARVTAAAAGGRVTCVTAAAELGLWTRSTKEVHVALASTASRIGDAPVVAHYATGPIPLPSRSSDEPLLNVLFHTARCLETADALAVWESALRKQMTTADELAGVHWHSTRARLFASVAGCLSDSGLETRFIWLMSRVGVSVVQQVWIDGHPVDGLIGERLVVQIDGFEHHQRAKDRRRDIRADARLILQGYTVLRFDYHQLLLEPRYVQETVLAAIAQGLHRAR